MSPDRSDRLLSRVWSPIQPLTQSRRDGRLHREGNCCRPFGALVFHEADFHGLTPVATCCHPCGAERLIKDGIGLHPACGRARQRWLA